jgi:predicted ATP-grasp superfamily ATP-dependent carboligase
MVADLFSDADLRHFATATRVSPYPDGCVDWLRAVEPSAWMYTGALENHPDLVDQMAWIAPLWGNSGDVLAEVRSPWQLADALREAGLLFPETRSSPDGLPQDGTWLVKTYQGASGSGVRELQTRRQGDKETRRDSSPSTDIDSPCLPLSLSPCPVFQRRIAGIPCSAVFVAAAGSSLLLGLSRQLIGESWLGAHGFQYAGSIGPWPVSPGLLESIKRIGAVLAARFELIGLFGVDLIMDDHERVWTLEVNPRYTASVELIERATGVQAIGAHAAACRGLEISDCAVGVEQAARQTAIGSAQSGITIHGKAILFAKSDVVISSGFAEAALAEAVRQPWPSLADVPPAGTQIEAGRPILTFFVEGATTDEVESRLRQRVTELERQINRKPT